jgi:transcriptional regulator with PAS, ATPase and Fis domain
LGRTREDFFYRIHIVPVDLPPLRSRKEDIPLLVDQFIRDYDPDGKITTLPGNVMRVIYDYDWPGNVRELQNAIHRFITIGRLDLVPTRKCDKPAIPGEKEPGSRTGSLRVMIRGLEKEMISEALRQGNGNKTKAAALLGIPRKTLYRKLTENDS